MYDVTQMTTASQMEIRTCQRTVALLNKLRVLTQMRESHQFSLLSQLVQVNEEEFTSCHEEWWNPCPNLISTEIKVYITCHLKLLQARWMKTSSMTPIFNFRSG